MTKARTYSNSGLGRIRSIFSAIILTVLTASTMNLNAQCTLQLLYNGIDVTGQTSFTQTLAPGECATFATFELVVSDGVPTLCAPLFTTVLFPTAAGLNYSNITKVTTSFEIGSSSIIFTYANGVPSPVIYPTITLTVNQYPNPITSLACNDDIQVSLNQNCSATITADMMLEGGPYKCYDLYVVEVRDARGNPIDRDPIAPGVQLDGNDFGNCYETSVIDTATGNSCWGELCVEDKLPPTIVCDAPIVVDCGTDISPDAIGSPVVTELCGTHTLTYVDIEELRGCGDPDDLERVIFRTWTATDLSGNSASCTQEIHILLGLITDVVIPDNYDDIEQPALECDEKIDLTKNIAPHIINFPLCVDGYLLDSARWVATGGTPAGGDLSGERYPKVLGWNCMPSGPYEGHPSPSSVYYDEHPSWRFGGCWGPDDLVKWAGTGFPSGIECSNINYTFSDVKIDVADPNCNAGEVGCYKILRKWTILNWCDGMIKEEYQIIKVLDKKGPTITYPDEITVGMVGHACTGLWNVAIPWITDNCSEEVHYDLRVTSGTVIGNENTGFTVIDLPAGMHTAFITAYDCCGQSTTHEVKITVEDNVPPVAICDDRTIISLSGNPASGLDYSKLCAESLDNGSYDNCNKVYFKVIRMDALLGTVNGSYADNAVACGGADADDDALRAGGQVYFDDCANFCCADLDTVIMVVLRVFDIDPGIGPVAPFMMDPAGYLAGHFTDCMVEVEVQDKSTPLVVAPPDLVVNCMFWFDDSEDALSDPDSDVFGRVVTEINLRKKVTTETKLCEQFCHINAKTGYNPANVQNGLACDFYNDKFDAAHPDDLHELTWGFDGYVLSTCGTDFEIRIIDNRECGQGLIIREVIVRRGNSYFRDRQHIWVVDCDPFYVSDDCYDFNDDIRWPLDCRQPDIIEGCSNVDTSPDNPLLGRPVIENGADDNCAMIAIDYKDEVFTVEPDACYKIIRTWRVIDWCLYDPLNPGSSDGRWEYKQIIKVLDKVSPTVTCIIGDCEPAVKDVALQQCFGHLSLTVDADDDCTPDNWLNYEYKIDLDNDGSIDAFSGPAKPGSSAFNYDNPFADDAKDATDASGIYPIGVHRITWYVEDGCGNVGTCDSVFRVKDCKLPTPYCKPGIITVVMPSTGSIAVWASDLNDSSFDNCTWPENLKYYFNGDTKWTNYVINCDTFLKYSAIGKVRIEVQMWVEDEEGNADFCKTIIEVQDPNGICGPVSGVAIAGKIHTENAEYVDAVGVDLMSGNNLSGQRQTSNDGFFAFMDITENKDYDVDPFKDGDYLNGVTTKDLVKIQRHLLGISEITSPYKLIAADANNSQDVGTSDISTLRKLILGIDTELEYVDSWRFVPTSFTFEDRSNPWSPTAFPEEISYADLTSKKMSSDFVAIKIGDVTGDALVNANGNVTRSNDVVAFEINDGAYLRGETVTVPVSISEATSLAGYQFTMVYDDNTLVLEDILFTQSMNESNFAIIENGVITVSWNDFSSTMIENDVFTLVFSATADGQIRNALKFNSSITTAEAYDQELNTSRVELNVNGQVVDGEFELYQNVPNPFGNVSVIGFDLPKEMTAMMTIYDVMGKVVRIIDVDGVRGYNEISVNKTDLNVTGILYYQLDAGAHTSTRKMILMN